MKIKRKIFCTSLCGIIALNMLMGTVSASSGKVKGAASVRIRKEANSSSEVISVATEGENVEVIGQEDGWYKVNFEDITGYIRSDLVETDYNENSPSAVTNNSEENINLSENTVESNSEADNSEVSNEALNTANDESSSNAISADIEINEKITLENEINIKKLPSFTSRSISNIVSGTEVTILDKLNNWVKVTDGSITGWITKESIQAIGNQPVENTSTDNTPSDSETSVDNTTSSTTNNSSSSNSSKSGIIKVDSARVRQEPDGAILGVVDLNDKVEILEEDGDWYKVNVGEYTNCYISKSLVKVD